MNYEDETIYANGFEEALIGVGRQFTRSLAVYDYDKCVSILMSRDGMDEHDAIEFIEFNVVGTWVGENTPVFVARGSE